MLEIHNVSKAFGSLRVLSDLSMTASAGRVTAVLGPNAAGKTTLAKIVAGLVHADGGSVVVCGNAIDASGAYKRNLGYMPQHPAFPDNLSPADMLELLRRLRGLTGTADRELIEELKLDGHLGKQFRTLSGGTKQKVNAVSAFLFSPSLLVLDEPTSGLDAAAAGILKDKIRACRTEGRTIVLTSHVMSEIEELADDILILSEGGVGFFGDVAELKQKARQTNIERAVAVLMRETVAA